MANNDTISKTLIVALALCIVCSVVVSTAAVMLKPSQLANKELDRKYNILLAAGLMDEGAARDAGVVNDLFTKVETRAVDLATGKFSDAVDTATYDQRAASKDPKLSQSFKELGIDDTAKIIRRESVALVYLVKGDAGYDKIILPVHGYGLWSTLYGFMALEGDANTVAGFGFYAHAETPGLGGEVDNPNWKAKWPGKLAYGESGSVAVQVVKGTAAADSAHDIDGLAGATLTSRGVSNLVNFWLGENGFAPFLRNLKAGGA